MKITDVKIIVCSPGRNFVTVKIFTDEGLTGVGDATLNGREKAVVAYLEDHLAPLPDRPRSAPHRGHLAVFLQGRLLAPRPGDDGGDRRHRHGTLGHQGQGRQHAALPASRRREPREGAVLHPRPGHAISPKPSRRSASARNRATRRSASQVGIPGLPDVYGTGKKSVTNNAARRCVPARGNLVDVEISALRARSSSRPCARPTAGTSSSCTTRHHRLTPIEAARLGKDLEFAPPVLARGHGCRRASGGLPPDPQAHHDAACRRRGVQHDLGCAPAHRGAAHRLYPHDDVHAGGVTALRRIMDFASVYNVRTACHGAMDMSPICLGANLHLDLWVPNFGIQEYSGYLPEILEVFPSAWSLTDGYLHPGRGDRPRRRYRRETCGQISLPARLSAGEPSRRRHAVALVIRGKR